MQITNFAGVRSRVRAQLKMFANDSPAQANSFRRKKVQITNFARVCSRALKNETPRRDSAAHANGFSHEDGRITNFAWVGSRVLGRKKISSAILRHMPMGSVAKMAKLQILRGSVEERRGGSKIAERDSAAQGSGVDRANWALGRLVRFTRGNRALRNT